MLETKTALMLVFALKKRYETQTLKREDLSSVLRRSNFSATQPCCDALHHGFQGAERTGALHLQTGFEREGETLQECGQGQ